MTPGREALAIASQLRFGDPPRCLEAARHAWVLLTAEGDEAGLIDAALLCAVSRGRLGERHRALRELAGVRDRYAARGDEIGQALTDLASGTNYLRLGEIEGALELFSQAEEVLRANEHREWGACLSALALTQSQSGDHASAVETLSRALVLPGLPLTEHVAVLINRGAAYSALGRTDEALADVAAAEPLIKRMPDPPNAPIYGWMWIEQEVVRVRCMVARGEMVAARKRAEQLLEQPELSRVTARGEVMRMLSHAWRSPPDADAHRALGLLERGLVWARQEDDDPLEERLLSDLAMLRRDLGDLEGALSARDMADVVRARVHRQNVRQRLASLRTRMEIDALRRERERLSAANAALERLSRDQRGLIEVLGHDLRNPLSTVLAYAEMLTEDGLPPDTLVRAGETIRDAARRMGHLVDSLTSEGARSTGQWLLRSESLDLAEGLSAMLEAWHGRAAAKGVDLEYGLPVDAVVQVDRVALAQIVDNLVSNAVKFTPGGGRVRVEVHSDEGEMKLSVEDSGPGFAAHERELVLQRFVRGTAEPTDGESSSGLGLSLVVHLAERLGGQVTLGTSEWGGARVQVTLSP